ncbi:MAG: hypothetical protein LUQ11_05760 [Methylococcaceae bacterium]|nr:hypothetical protein [Methylococcaceae bacterium]
MQRFYHGDENGFTDHLEINRQTAFHEAGHVAAICLENKRKSLPLIHFEIRVGKQDILAQPLFAKVSGGRLVGDLATVIHQDVSSNGDSSNIDSYQLVYEADIINFLAGPLAEAKYISIRDNEVFNINLLTPQAINHYGGNADMLEVMSYLEFFIPSPVQREAKLNALFAQAFRFVQQPSNWKSITALAHYILNNAHENISCEQAIEVLTAGVKK